MASIKNLVNALADQPGNNQKLGKRDFDLTNGAAGERSLVASVKAEVPFRIRGGVPGRLAFATAEEFTTDGTADDTETFNLSSTIVESPNTTSFVLFDDGQRVNADAVDYGANSFDYTDPEGGSTLTAFYVARDPGPVVIEKEAPKTQSSVTEEVYEDITAAIHERDQNKEPVVFEFDKPMAGVVPKNWRLNIYVDAPAAVAWNDAGLANPQGAVAPNPIINLPIRQYERSVDGLADGVVASALGLE